MNVFQFLAVVALVATVVTLGLGIRSMIKGGVEDERFSTHWMLRRVEFQAAALAFVIAAVLLAGGLAGDATPRSAEGVEVDLGVLPAAVIATEYGADSPEVQAYGGAVRDWQTYLVTVALRDRDTGQRIESADVRATVGRLGLSGTTKQLKAARFNGATTYGGYFELPRAGIYEVVVRIDRPGAPGTERVRLQYRHPGAVAATQ